LEKSLDRIKAVADSAETERAARIEQITKDYEAYTKRTGKKKRFDPNNVEGGAKAVNKIVGPLVRAIRSAKEHYEKTLHEQLAQAAAGVNKLPDTN
jgi:transcription initiation factor TFIIH subunit 1